MADAGDDDRGGRVMRVLAIVAVIVAMMGVLGTGAQEATPVASPVANADTADDFIPDASDLGDGWVARGRNDFGANQDAFTCRWWSNDGDVNPAHVVVSCRATQPPCWRPPSGNTGQVVRHIRGQARCQNSNVPRRTCRVATPATSGERATNWGERDSRQHSSMRV